MNRQGGKQWWTIRIVVTLLIFLIEFETLLRADSPGESQSKPAAKRGYHWLRTKPYLPADFDDQVFEELWKVWPEPLRSQASMAMASKRWEMTFSYYGIMQAPDQHPGGGPALGYVKTPQNGWVMNCLTCHGGKVAGRVIPGLPNSHVALQTLTEDVRLTKLRLRKKLSHLDVGTLSFPLGGTDGTTNSVIFGVLLTNLRDDNMKVLTNKDSPQVEHHDMDAPPFWNVKKKTRIYVDGHIAKTHRPLMQFMLLPVNDEKTVKAWEPDFRDVLAWIESVEAPAWPWDVNHELAKKGEGIFNQSCAKCHGTYGDHETYPEREVPLKIIGTDPVRLESLTHGHLEWMKKGWMSRHGKDYVNTAPQGYVAPPLNGVWASAPYFHNGSVPTLWHVMHPQQRPVIWKRTENGYDQNRVGLEVATFEEMPTTVKYPSQRRRYFDTRKKSKSAAGHNFPERLTEPEKHAVLEYLKTL